VVKDSTGNVVWIEDRRPTGLPVDPNSRQSAATAAYQFLDKVKNVLQITNTEGSFELTEATTDQWQQTHLRMQQYHLGLPVYGGEVILHTLRDTLRILNGRSFPSPRITNVAPAINRSLAEKMAMTDVGKKAIIRPFADPFTNQFTRTLQELVIYHPSQNPEDPRLTWHLTLRPNLMERWEYFVDAQSGEVLHSFNHTCGLDGPVTARSRDLNGLERTFGSYQVGNNLFMIDATKSMFNQGKSQLPDNPMGAIWTIDAGNTEGKNMKVKHVTSTNAANWNATAVSAHTNAGISFEYFLKTFNRNSLNGKGGTIISLINVADEDGGGLDNAFWNGEYMGYGNGRDAFRPLAASLDVAGHEMTHGVIENTARLEYQGQSGAINESMADVFGVLIDRDDWTLGEDVVSTRFYPTGALRSMANPNQEGAGGNGYQPKTMAQYITTKEDNGGVHSNSGIPNHAFYLFAIKVGKEKAEKVYYRALTTYLTRRSQFLDLRLAIIQASTDLFGANSTEITSVKQAFDQVGIMEGQTGQPPQSQEIPVNTGNDGILVYGVNNSTLYQTTPQLANFRALSNKGITHKASITDDGQLAYYISNDKRIRAVALTGTSQEYVVQNETIWDNVAISRDGKKLAALKSDAENSIWVYSFDRKEWKKFTLYNPTYTKGVNTGEVQYADAFEWDVTGEYIVYDAFNEIKNLDGTSLEYWDVGFINVWNTAQKKFGDGTIEKLFSDLDEGENIGNPVFSKNNSSILAFDYFDETDDSYYLLGVNIESGELDIIYENNTLGFPDYSRTDEQMLFNMESGTKENVGIIGMGKDRISSSGTAKTFIQDGKWASWFGQGTRSRQSQTISFGTISDKTIGGSSFQLVATASSALGVRFEKLSGGISIQGNAVSITQAGKASIRALQDGNTSFLAATLVDRTFCVNPTKPVITQDVLNLTASSQGADKFTWYENGSVASGASSAVLVVDRSGEYTARAVTPDGCQSTLSNGIQILILANDPGVFQAVATYPNPVREELMIKGNLGGFKEDITITDASGRLRKLGVKVVSPQQWQVSMGQLPPGLYILNLEREGKKQALKLIKE
jgi:Zn-dependent metalloprotease